MELCFCRLLMLFTVQQSMAMEVLSHWEKSLIVVSIDYGNCIEWNRRLYIEYTVDSIQRRKLPLYRIDWRLYIEQTLVSVENRQPLYREESYLYIQWTSGIEQTFVSVQGGLQSLSSVISLYSISLWSRLLSLYKVDCRLCIE